MPGFMYHLEPHGDRVIGLGIDRTDPGGSLNVSLFDVADADNPRMLARVPFATPNISEDYAILDSEVAEDQDRIQKAFRVFSDGVVVVPFSTPQTYYAAAGSSCDNLGGGVQVVQWQSDTLTKRALLPLPGNPRRAFELDQQMVTVSDSNVRTFSLETAVAAHQTADVVIGTCVADSSTPYYGGGNFVGGGRDAEYPRACSAAPGEPAGWHLFAMAVAGLIAARRRARRSSP
jgi:hypothetical protein